MAFWRGQKVVCVKADSNPQTLTLNAVYTISHFSSGYANGQPAVHVMEASSPDPYQGYYLWRFRPLKDTSKQVELLKRKLLPKSKTVRERA